MILDRDFKLLATELNGDVHWDKTIKVLYSTDASVYRELPLAVAYPKVEDDIRKLILFAKKHHTSIIPRAAGTSLAGQCVGQGIIMDISRHFTKILEVNQEEGWVRVQPGVIRDELNMHLKKYGFLFGPETSTANRAMIGGMIGNNSCGANSIVYGSTRDRLLEVTTYLSDGSKVSFMPLSTEEFHKKCDGENCEKMEQEIYQSTFFMLSDPDTQEEIDREYPKPEIHRRNTGYAIDILKESDPLVDNGTPFNFCKLIAGSEGTLVMITEAKLAIDPLPPPNIGLLCVHFDSIRKLLEGNIIALKYHPTASELMDHYILECTKENIVQRENRFFVKGDPHAILIVEFRKDSVEEIKAEAEALTRELKSLNLGDHYPLIMGEDTDKVWELRKAGLGLLGNIPGDAKSIPVVEDTAVTTDDLPDYIDEFDEVLGKYDLDCVKYAHVGDGEIHLRPILNLKTQEGVDMFHTIGEESAKLVKKYNGSLSGEHGDGRVRGEFIPIMVGEKNYNLLKKVKHTWDPDNIFNPGKIVETPPMNQSLRYKPGQATREFNTLLNFDATKGLLRAAEKCNGVGACRKTHLSGGTMCPSYMATKDEKDTTRARANILREILTHSEKSNPFNSDEIFEVMDLCLSCKGCKSECPSNVDVAKLKAEFQYQYYKDNPIPFGVKMMGNFSKWNKLSSIWPGFSNFILSNPVTGGMIKRMLGIAKDRSIPLLYKTTLRKWYHQNKETLSNISGENARKIFFFCDEFSNYLDVEIGIKALKLLSKLGYDVQLVDHAESGRSQLSKGFLDTAKKYAVENVMLFSEIINSDTPLIGLEPSAILTFRDEYPDLVPEEMITSAKSLAENVFLIEEFLAREIDRGIITSKQFNRSSRTIKYHGHCHQKVLSSLEPVKKVLSLPENHKVEIIPSGCCGMAGSFGYEKKHYDVSMKIGELVLFPAVRGFERSATVVAPGTSCRHQIKDGTGKVALHPVEVLLEALN